jgi:hypothetical protein
MTENMEDSEPANIEEANIVVNLIDVLLVLNDFGLLKGYTKIPAIELDDEHEGCCRHCGHDKDDCVCLHNELLKELENIVPAKNS